MANVDKIPCPGCGAAMEIVPREGCGLVYGFQYHCPRCGWDAPLKRTERDALEAARKRVTAEVVRCKDCLSGWPLPDGAKPFVREDCLVCAVGRGDPTCGYSIVAPDDYCSDGCKVDGGGTDHENV